VAVTYCRQKRERGKRRMIVAKGKSEGDGIVREGRKGLKLKLGSSGGFCLIFVVVDDDDDGTVVVFYGIGLVNGGAWCILMDRYLWRERERERKERERERGMSHIHI